MVVVSGEGMQLLPCSTSQNNKHVIIYYPRPDMEFNLKGLFVSVPVDRLISRETLPSQVDRNFEIQELPRPGGKYFVSSMTSFCTPATRVRGGERTSPALYFFGGLEEPPENSPYQLRKEYVSKNVYKYDLLELPKIVSVISCNDMLYGMHKPLVVQVGGDFLFVLGHGKTELNDTCTPVFQKFNFKENLWFPLGSDDFVDMINNCDCDKQVRARLSHAPHVVIGHYLHVSVGNSSFTYDTANNVWKDCKLFETFWSEREESGFSPTNFYGRSVWDRAFDVKVKKRKISKYGGGGPPFGFHGKGILWDGNILLGIHYAPNCAVVAFLFDDKTERVVRSQRLCLDGIVSDGRSLNHGARLLDLGGDGYFCLVHFHPDYNMKESAYTFQIELVTFQVSRVPKQTADGHGDYDDDHFVDCKLVRKEFVAKKCPDNIGNYYNAFCV